MMNRIGFTVGAGLALPGSEQDNATEQDQKGAASGAPTKDLPTGWEWKTLGEIADILDNQRVPVNAKERGQRIGNIPYYGATGQVGWIDDYLFDEELILLGEDGAPFHDSTKQKAYVIRGKSWVNNHAHVLRARNGLPNIYLKHYLDIVDYHSFVTGTTRFKLNQAAMRQIPIPIAPSTEQNLIVAEIEKQFSRLDEAIAGLKRVNANLKRYKAAVLKSAVEGKLTEEWRKAHPNVETGTKLLKRILAEWKRKWEEKNPSKKYKEPVAPDMSNLPELPKRWAWATVAQIGALGEQTVLTGPFGSNLGTEDFKEAGVPVLTIGCLKETGISLDKAAYVSKHKAAELERYKLKAGDMLFSRMAAVGRAGYVTRALEGAIFNYHIMRLRLSEKAILTDYFISYVRGAKSVVDYLREINHGFTRDGINTDQLLSMPVALPPVEEQRGIVEEIEHKLSVVLIIEQELETALNRADRLRQSILKKAFSGCLVNRMPEFLS